MLRNTGAESPPEASDFLNEVLSLNAQESMTRKSISVLRALLNEVLSLNAQESVPFGHEHSIYAPQ